MKTSLSPNALRLILDYEVGGGEAYYREHLARPSWPGGASGVTIGIGYDLGHTPRARFLADWRDLDGASVKALMPVLGLRGRVAESRLGLVRKLVIPWEDALVVFLERTVPYWIRKTVETYPQAAELPEDAFGGLVSLIFNRGPALRGRNREEMWDIAEILADGVQAGDCKLIAQQLRAMKRIWEGRGLDGLVRRREAEARLVEAAV